MSAADSDLRLISGKPVESGADSIWAGIQIRLDPGWKTYWRNPGDSGVPPYFDWSGSSNLKSVDVLYPAPGNFEEAGGISYGYKNEVVFPLRVTPKDPSEPVDLKLQMEYGLCKDICIPNQAELSMALPPEPKPDSGTTMLLDRYLALVPKPQAQGKLPAIVKVTPELGGKTPTLLIEANFPKNSERTDLYIEAEGEYVPPPELVGSDGGTKRFTVAFQDMDEAEALKGKRFTLTLVGDRGAREASWRFE
ncbi:protein-disulfide reductase DsbD domain-containing protein [Methyloligella sp. 2.7D]|uniref:protein-disulfide reductase DsbD domain-containing protein n=1 Tax=unclassified Methyloligella TaxID=2625955 RepID=UPI00157DD053|nr:protein-disulfide reductase DsbD domain-containing protein [Methyloligella sp. GL2]QKP78320.1 hypothetical protein HT051_13245 [Methyloligella sp. GL2]